MPSHLRTILFDFDYTPANSLTGAIACAKFTREALNCMPSTTSYDWD